MAAPVAVHVTYDADLDRVDRLAADVAREVMREVDGGVPDATPAIRFQKLGAATIQFTAFLTTRDVDTLSLRLAFPSSRADTGLPCRRASRRGDRSGGMPWSGRT